MLKLVGAGAAASLLAACAPKESAPAATEKPAEATEPPPTEPPEEAAPTHEMEVQLPEQGAELEGFVPMMTDPGEPIELLYWWGNNWEPGTEFTHDIISRFSEAYPNVTVEPVAGQNCDAFLTAVAAGTAIDAFHTWDCVERMGNWAKRGLILPLDDYVAASDYDEDNYVPGILDTCKMDGKLWGVVDSAGVFLCWTHPQHFEEIGKSATDVPQDSDEMWEWARELTTTDADGNIERLGGVLPTWLWPRLTWLVNFGAVLWDMDANEPTPDHPGVIAGLQDFKDQVEHWGLEAVNTWSASIGSQGGAQSPWLAQNATFEIEGDWSGQSIFEFFPDWEFGVDYGAIAPPPAPASKLEGESMVAWWSWPWVVPSTANYPDWGWELLRFFLTPFYQLNVRARFKETETNVNLMGSEKLWWPAAKVAHGIVQGGRALSTVMPMNPVAAEYLNLIGEAMDNVIQLAEEPEEAMARVKDEILVALAEQEE
jgi:ABC-type glycerol-3-phosphate transport system substrate-binding protein